MSRYLTPSKISLLVLVSLYCDSVVPNQAIIPVLSFIVTRLIPSTTASASTSPVATINSDLTVADLENLLKHHQSNQPGRTLLDQFLKTLWSIDCLHALHQFFNDLDGYLVPPHGVDASKANSLPDGHVALSRVSPLGVFLRRARLEFTRIQFHDAVSLWTAFLKFRAPTEASWRKKNPSAPRLSLDTGISELSIENKSDLLQACYGSLDPNQLEDAEFSTEDIEAMLQFQLDRLQKLGNRMPEDMKVRFRDLMGQIATMPSLAHFVRFFDAWRAGDYSSAFENLHRYFDYTTHTRDKSYYQYALLHMAILQADFGCFSEAIAAMNETIATARENQDVSCLNFSLSWLNHLSKAYPKEMRRAGYVGMLSSESENLEFLKNKAKETKMWNLYSSTLLSETKLLLSSGEGIPQALEYLYQSAHLNIAHNIQSNHGTQLLMQSSVYGRLGLNHLADTYCEILLDCHAINSPVDDIVRSLCRRAYAAMQMGQYKQAASKLSSIDPSLYRTLKLEQYTLSYAGLLKLKRVLRRNNLTAASNILEQLKTGASSEPDLEFQLFLLAVDYHIRLSNYATAFTLISQKLTELKSHTGGSDIYHFVQCLTLKARLFVETGRAGRGFTLAMRAVAIAMRCKLCPMLWEGVGVLATVLGSMGEFNMARRLLDSVIPQALGGGDTALSAQLYSWQADACMGLAGATSDPRTRTSLISKSEHYVDRAGHYFHKISDTRSSLSLLAKKATIARLRGDSKLAEDWATKYLDFYQTEIVEGGEDGIDT
ncbi:hypothetical protein FKW77_010842 [Venturia effusa]|uniref:Anaphase-promoting complex subunit 5 n=1 Tax=Venturia effusa TaxID=50376 RepID=A0A517KYM0_9PEZI|nr:hypothetical protein FKW77_010842 [Venturia effusa]